MSETYPKRRLQNAFCKTYLPSSVNFDCKGTTKNRYMQIKIAFLRNFYSILVYIQKN